MSPPPKLQLQHIHKAFGTKQVLNDIQLDVAQGESLVIIGGSGTGKSVLLKCILGLLQPDSGAILKDGQDITQLSRTKRQELMRSFGMLFQGGALFDSLPVWHNITFALLNANTLSKAKAKKLAEEKLHAVGLAEEVAYLMPAELSGGMQKRVALARAIAGNPDIIFFDEPTTGLDPIMADVINNLIVKCVEDLGATTITITHDMASVRKIADKVAMLYQGNIIWHGNVEDIDHSQNPYVEQFVHGRSEGPITFAKSIPVNA